MNFVVETLDSIDLTPGTYEWSWVLATMPTPLR